MVNITKLTASAIAVICLSCITLAHPGEKHDHAAMARQIAVSDHNAKAAKRSLATCSSSLKHRQVEARSRKRRADAARELRGKRGISAPSKKYRRDLATLETYEAINHNETGIVDYSIESADTTIFSANTSCILTPEVTDGPYYVVGESIRQDVTEGQAGVPLRLEVQYLDINTCLPVEAIYVDIWNCNATGVYSGINITGNVADGGYTSTYLRGIQGTNDDGVVTFDTIFPGHYEGRATHTHLLAHENVTVLSNGTIASNTVTHIGQVFWDEGVRAEVRGVWPYNTNTQNITTNANDMWSIVQAENDYDPFPEYMYLGDDITDGLLVWIQIDVNVSANYVNDDYYSVAAVIGEDGPYDIRSDYNPGA